MNNLYLVFCFVNIFVFSVESAPTGRVNIFDWIQDYTKTNCIGLNKNVLMDKNMTYLSNCKDVFLDDVPESITFQNLNTFLCVGILEAELRLCNLLPAEKISELPKNFKDLREQIEPIKISSSNETCKTFKNLTMLNDSSENVAKLSSWMTKFNKKLYGAKCSYVCADFDGTNIFCSMLLYVNIHISTEIQRRNQFIIKPADTNTVGQKNIDNDKTINVDTASVLETEQSPPKTSSKLPKTPQTANAEQISNTQSDSTTKPNYKIKPVSEIPAEAKNEAESNTQPGSNTNPGPNPNPGSNTIPDPNSRSDSATKPDSKTNTESVNKQESKMNTLSNNKPDSESKLASIVTTKSSIKSIAKPKPAPNETPDVDVKSSSAQISTHTVAVTQGNVNQQAVVPSGVQQNSVKTESKPATDVTLIETKVQHSAPDTAQMAGENKKETNTIVKSVNGNVALDSSDTQDKNIFVDILEADVPKDKQENFDPDMEDDGDEEDTNFKEDGDTNAAAAAAAEADKDAEIVIPPMQDQSTSPRDYGDVEDSNFFVYFMFISVMFIAGYVVYHNKQKILALVLEGRRDRNSRRRPNTASYRKLNSNLEEAVTSKCSGSASHVIY